MVTPAGDVTTLAGSGNYFLTDGTAAAATFSESILGSRRFTV